ncbi:cytokinin oxidase/dehydrogenase 6 [Prunus dulcis]|uniref:cytokinin dehydrogenase n=1 Tax=Prunus dulcis TaxID=3755 RepID=A0A4Y1QX81_PRUDU|nr:cytokinin oxidase/dehydrogenase 6 [Prunus dulcis]
MEKQPSSLLTENMRYPPVYFLKQMNTFIIKGFMILFVSCVTIKLNLCSPNTPSLNTLPLDGHFNFHEVHHAARDFGNRYQFLPMAVLHPKRFLISPLQLSIFGIWVLIQSSQLQLEAMATHSRARHKPKGELSSIWNHSRALKSKFTLEVLHMWMSPVLEIWISAKVMDRLPTSNYGGTLSNAGISGQAFRHGPQISNVHQLEVVTDEPNMRAGKGEVINCSEEQNEDLFHSVLGGLGQFGIITRARISLEAAPARVKWIRVLYSDFAAFTQDQEHLISSENTFDYVEGFVIINRTGLLNNWRSSFNSKDPVQASQFKSDGRTLFCLELAKYFNLEKTDLINEVRLAMARQKPIENFLSRLSYIRSTLFMSEVAYIDFLDRVHVSEIKLRSKDLWDVPHPWLNLLIPKSKIHTFAEEVFGSILTATSNGPILIYPVNRSRWDNRTSVVIPEEHIFYLVAFLTSAVPSSTGTDGLEHILTQNKRILEFCETAHLGVKQYLPHYTTKKEWQAHFGPRWEAFVQRKSAYDPLAILAPGQRIFQKAIPFS